MKRQIYLWLLNNALPNNLRLNIQEKSIRKKYIKELVKVSKENDPDKTEEIKACCYWELEEIEHERSALYTAKLKRKAVKLRVPIPTDGIMDIWEITSSGYKVLTDYGITVLREDIRKEERWLQEKRNHWLTIITAIAGLIGVITGFVAVIYK